MTYIRWLNEIQSQDRDWAGDKAVVLGELHRAGFSIPRAFCVGAGAYLDTCSANGLNAQIIAHLNQIDMSDPAQLEQAAEEIRAWITLTPLSAEIEQEFQAALDDLNTSLTAVRVSRVSEDVPNPSASGLQQGYLGVPAAAALAHLRQCWAAPWNSRAIYFRHRKKIPPDRVALAVIVQTMINSDAAGVMFTASPLNKNRNEIHIDAIWGLGEPVVAARWRPDHFVVDPASGAAREKNIASKTVMNIAVEGGLQTVGVPEEKQERACLTDAQLVALARTGLQIQTRWQEPQDIEWCIKDDQIFILQSRPMRK